MLKINVFSNKWNKIDGELEKCLRIKLSLGIHKMFWVSYTKIDTEHTKVPTQLNWV